MNQILIEEAKERKIISIDEGQVRDHLDTTDFSWVREEVANRYGYNGNVSVDPQIIVKLLLLLFYDNVKSECELMRIVPERLDYLWFLGLNLDG